MTENVVKRDVMPAWKVRALGLGVAALPLVGIVAAEDINLTEEIGPILSQVSALMPYIIDLIVSIVPAILVMAVVGFIIAFFDRILSMIRL